MFIFRSIFRRLRIVVLVMLLQVSSIQLIAQVNIIPLPLSVFFNPTDSFTLNKQTIIITEDKSLQASADFLNEYLQQFYKINLPVNVRKTDKNIIRLSVVTSNTSIAGGYTLIVNTNSISITGNDPSGVFYGIQSLVQLFPHQKDNLTLHGIKITDVPRYQYRGMMLDVCRHFFPVSFVKKYIDNLALHKINYFHWHLTDDQGWRIEIKKYPKLTQVGAYRDGTIIGHYPGTGNDSIKYGGYYTQKEIKEIVAYASKRYITVVPEIEMPGHASAALTAYPYLGCTGGPYIVRQTWGVSKDVFCAGNDSVFTFLENVLDEVMSLFPSKYIHVGGDECPKDRWKECLKCQKRIKDNNLKDEHELQSYFIQRIEKYINSKGRILIGWDEILEGGLAPNAVVMNWHGEKGGIEAAKQKHYVIMTPNAFLYFDQYQGKAADEPLAIGGYNPLSKVYSYNPTPSELTATEEQYLKGVQANLWTEYITTPQQAEYMLTPRIDALSEIAWTQPGLKNFENFKQRMEKQYERYDILGITYSKAVFNVRQTILIETAESKATVSFATDSYKPRIYYTLDGSEPTTKSLLYEKSFIIRKSATIKAGTFKDGKMVGKTSVQQVFVN
jgi:hexosaminidase